MSKKKPRSYSGAYVCLRLFPGTAKFNESYTAGILPAFGRRVKEIRFYVSVANNMSGVVARNLSGFMVSYLSRRDHEADRVVTGDPEDEIRGDL